MVFLASFFIVVYSLSVYGTLPQHGFVLIHCHVKMYLKFKGDMNKHIRKFENYIDHSKNICKIHITIHKDTHMQGVI